MGARDFSDLCRKLRLPSNFDVFQLCWEPDYDRFFFDQLKKRRINIAAELGFIGRVMHGNHPKKWLNDLRARIGEPVDSTLTAAAM